MAALLKQHCGVNAALVRSSGGVFEVVINDQLVYSKRATGVFPDEQQLLQSIQALLG